MFIAFAIHSRFLTMRIFSRRQDDTRLVNAEVPTKEYLKCCIHSTIGVVERPCAAIRERGIDRKCEGSYRHKTRTTRVDLDHRCPVESVRPIIDSRVLVNIEGSRDNHVRSSSRSRLHLRP